MALKEMAKFPREELMVLLDELGEAVVRVDMEEVFADVGPEGGERVRVGLAPSRGENGSVAHVGTGSRVGSGSQTGLPTVMNHTGLTAPVARVKRRSTGADREGSPLSAINPVETVSTIIDQC